MTASTLNDHVDLPQRPHALTVEGVHKSFGAASPVLAGIDLEVGQQEFLTIVGPSGCGKTTLLRIIQGLETASSGVVRTETSDGRAPRMSYVFQRASLLPWYTVRDNVAFGVTVSAGRDIYPTKKDRDAAIDDLLDLTGLREYAHYYPDQISGGMQQRANVARALAVRPDVLLLDEPFSALDALTREKLQIEVAGILEKVGTTGILVTHDIREAVFLSDRIVVLGAHPGRIREIVDVAFDRPRTAEFQHGPELARLERQIWEMLHG